MNIRIGQGYDVHIFGDGDHVSLGGVRIEHDRGVMAHSDGDVALHALCDAIYGALGEGDIGTHFPPSDAQWRDCPSIVFVRHAKDRMETLGYKIVNLDITIIAEAPKISPHAEAIREQIADMLGISASQTSIKATTHEKIGAMGRGEGLAALAIVLMEKE